MATPSSILAWGIPWTEVQSMGLQRVEHNLVTNTVFHSLEVPQLIHSTSEGHLGCFQSIFIVRHFKNIYPSCNFQQS